MSGLTHILDAVAPEGTPAIRRTWLRWGSGILVGAFTLFILSGNRDSVRCHQDCYGSLTYEPGHSWTSYADSWQWSVQHALTQFALIASIVGFGAALGERNPVRIYAAAIVALGVWLVWVLLLTPSVP